MTFSPKEAFLSRCAQELSSLYDRLSALEDIPLSSLPPEETALIVVDMVNGFAVEGAMASPRVGALSGPLAALTRACRRRGMPVVAFADSHTADSIELAAYPPHCLRGTPEARLVPELEEAARENAPGSFVQIAKNSTNGFMEPEFDAWRRENPSVSTYVVVGDCTDICIHQFALSAKAHANARNLPLRVLVPAALVDTFDAPGHPADLANAAALYSLRANGAELCRSLVY
ncbi:MAG TPA: cysteine hydrolase [Firmicutes bacterium]|nr:cysteine hydrolase [Bacillota bacterium]